MATRIRILAGCFALGVMAFLLTGTTHADPDTADTDVHLHADPDADAD